MIKLGTQPQSTTCYRNRLSSVETTQRLPSVTPDVALARWEKPRSSPGTWHLYLLKETAGRQKHFGARSRNATPHRLGTAARDAILQPYGRVGRRHPESSWGKGEQDSRHSRDVGGIGEANDVAEQGRAVSHHQVHGHGP